MEVDIILNPVSGIGTDIKGRKKRILQAAKSLDWKGTLIETTPNKHAGLIAEELVKRGAKHLIVGGGDGTVMEVIGAIIKKPVKLGIVPLGTGNLFANNLGLSLNIEDALKVAFQGRVKKIDVGRANGIYFSLIAGIGIDAQVMKETERGLKDKLGVFAYVISVIKNIHNHSGKYRVTIDKTSKVFRAKTIMIANMGKLQGGIEAVPAAKPQNGVLRIGIVKASSTVSWLNILFNALRGDINKSPHYTLLTGKHIEIVSLNGPKPLQCDGDYLAPVKKLTVDIYPKAVSVLV